VTVLLLCYFFPRAGLRNPVMITVKEKGGLDTGSRTPSTLGITFVPTNYLAVQNKQDLKTTVNTSVSPRADLFHQLLAATRRRRKITKPPSHGHAPFNQVSNFGRDPFNQVSNFGCAPFNQVSNFGRAPFNQVSSMGAPLSVSKTKILPSPHFN
jgi:hypothetical protein